MQGNLSWADFNKHWVYAHGHVVHKDSPRKLSGKALLAYKKTLGLTELQKDALIGTLLGHGFLKYHHNTKVPVHYFEFAQSVIQANYVVHVYQLWKPFVGMVLKINLIGGIKPGKPARYEPRFKTYSHVCFKPYADLFYPPVEGKRSKCVPNNIASMLSPRALAYWYMDDGNRGPRRVHYNFSCHGFHFDHAELLQQALMENFNLKSKIYDHGLPRLYIYAQSKCDFYKLVSSYIVPCVSYKL